LFDVSWSEVLLIGAVSVVVIGPKDLPRALHAAGVIIRKIKVFSNDIQKSLDKILQEAELDEITRAANRPGAENIQRLVEEQHQLEENRRVAAESAQKPVEKNGPT
jgi:sec-independent protein translocase protein TatB